MSALPRPGVTGAPRVLSDALHDLHHHAGWPSLRTLARETGVSHTTVSKVFSSPAVPPWGTLELLVEAMSGEAAVFHDLWLTATAPGDGGPGHVPHIAGRRAELAAVRRHLETGTGLLIVTGEAGIGKTTLVTKAADDVDILVATGHCLPLSIEAPLMPISDVLRDLLAIDEGRPMKSALSACPAFVARELTRLLPELDDAGVVGAPDGLGRQRLFTAVSMLLDALAQGGDVALCLEDLHWADPSTLDLIEHLCTRNGAPHGARGNVASVVGTWREDDPTTPEVNLQWRSRMDASPAATTRRLAPLSREETRIQLAALGRESQLDAVYARSRGHPLFTTHLATHAPESGLPVALAELLDARLREVEDDAWKVARTLGVADRPLPAGAIATVAGMEEDEVTAALHSLARRSLLGSSGESQRATLAHPLLAEAARRRLVAGEGPSIHRRLALALATLDGSHPAEIARHWRLAGDHAQEITWLVAAARDAGSRFDWAQEAVHWLRVLDLWPGGTTEVGLVPISRAGVHLAAIDALDESRRWHRAAELSDLAETMIPDLDDALRAEVLLRLANYRCEQEGVSVGLALIDEALDIFRRLPPSSGLLRAMSFKRSLVLSSGGYEEARTLAQEAAELAATLDDPLAERDALTTLAWHRGIEGGVQEAAPLLQRGQDLVADGSDPVGDIRQSVIATDILLLCAGRLDQVEAVGKVGTDVADAWEIDNMLALVLRANVATARLRAGRVAEAAELIGVDADADPDPELWPLHSVRALIDTLSGNPSGGVHRLTQMWSEIVTEGEVDLDELGNLAQLHFWNGSVDTPLERVLRDLEAVVDHAPARMLAPLLLEAARAVAETAGETGTEHGATIRDLHARAATSTNADPGVVAHDRTVVAEIARIDATDSVDHWIRAATLWDDLARPHDAAYCRWRGAQVALREGQGTVAGQLLRRATTDAREHVPLSEAIAATRAGTR